MAERKPKRKIEACTSAPLTAPPPPETDDPFQQIMAKLYTLAVEGNVTAAKLYLDYSMKDLSENANGLSLDEALKLLREQTQPEQPS